MSSGKLEVVLGNAKGLEDQNWLTSMNPYVVITCRNQEKESSVASGEGSEPEWNETFVFTISHDVEEITLKIMDKDTFSSDDFVGEATIPLHEVLREGEVPIRSYNVVKNEEYCGEIKIGLTFTAGSGSDGGSDEEEHGGRRKSRSHHRGSDEEEEYGGRKQSRDHSRRSDEEEYGGRRQSRDDYNGSDEDNSGRHRRSRDDDYGGSNED